MLPGTHITLQDIGHYRRVPEKIGARIYGLFGLPVLVARNVAPPPSTCMRRRAEKWKELNDLLGDRAEIEQL